MSGRLWPIATLVLGLATLAILLSFNLLPAVSNAYPYGTFGPAMSAFQRAVDLSDLAAIFGNPPDPSTVAAMDAGNKLDLYAFIPAYTLFLIAAAIMLSGAPKQPLAWIAIMLAIIAAVADVMETAAQLGVTSDWAHADMYLRFLAPAAWLKFFALAAHALVCGAIAFRSRRRIVAVLSVIPMLGVLGAATNLLQIPTLITGVFGVFWAALLVTALIAIVRPSSAAPAPDALA